MLIYFKVRKLREKKTLSRAEKTAKYKELTSANAFTSVFSRE